MRMIDDQPLGDLDDVGDQLFMLAVLDDQAPRGGAALAGAEEGGLNRDDRRGIGVGRVPDDERVVAAKLQRQDLFRRSENWRWSARPARPSR
jgi:hypothetical protein